MDPLVTIYLPTRGRPELLDRAVSSALAQRYPHIELVVAIDGPCEASERVLDRFASDARLVVHRRPTSGGAPQARNDAIFIAKGELITGLDDDDELLEDHVSGLVRLLTKTGAAFACTTNVLRRFSGDVVRHSFSGRVSLSSLLFENVVGNQVLTRTEYMRQVGGFDTEMPAWQDYELWIRLCRAFGDGQRIDARSYIQHTDHGSERISRPERIRLAHARLIEKHDLLLSDEQRLSLELLMYATTHQPYPWSRFFDYLGAGLGKRALFALLSDRIPAARTPFRTIQGWVERTRSSSFAGGGRAPSVRERS